MKSPQRDNQHNASNDLDQHVIYNYFLENCEPTYYSRIPNIIDILTYDSIDPETGEKTIKRLSVYAKELYRVIKNTCGETGACWRNRDQLADICNMSAGMVTAAKKELQQSFHQLNGNPLIKITKHQKNIQKDDKLISKTFYDKCMIVDIWKYNHAFFKTKEFFNKRGMSYEHAPSLDDIDHKAPSSDDDPSLGTPSPHDTNNNNLNKNPMFKEQQPASKDDPVVFSKKRIFVSVDVEKIYNYCVERGCEEPLAFSLANRYNLSDFNKAVEYLLIQTKKPGFTCKKSKWAYFQDILYNRYWEKK